MDSESCPCPGLTEDQVKAYTQFSESAAHIEHEQLGSDASAHPHVAEAVSVGPAWLAAIQFVITINNLVESQGIQAFLQTSAPQLYAELQVIESTTGVVLTLVQALLDGLAQQGTTTTTSTTPVPAHLAKTSFLPPDEKDLTKEKFTPPPACPGENPVSTTVPPVQAAPNVGPGGPELSAGTIPPPASSVIDPATGRPVGPAPQNVAPPVNPGVRGAQQSTVNPPHPPSPPTT